MSRTRRCGQRPGAGPAAGFSAVTPPGGVTALVTAPPVRCGGRAPWPGDSDVTPPPVGSRCRSRHRTCEAGPGPAARCSEGQGSRPLITPVSAARVRRGVTSPSHGGHCAPLRRATWSRRPRRASGVGHGGHGAGHGGHGADHGDHGVVRHSGTRPGHGGHGADLTPATAVTALVTAAPSAG